MTATDLDPFLLTAPLEILGVLRAVQDKKTLVRMHVPGRQLAVITTLLAIDPKRQSIIIDNASEDSVNQQLVKSEKISFETQVDKVRVLFSVPQISICDFEGKSALQIPLPDALTRLQRREYYRIEVPMSDGASCTFKFSMRPYSATLDIKDISCGGISVADPDNILEAMVSSTFEYCELKLPESRAPLSISLKVVRSLQERLANDKIAMRAGCQFIDLSNAARMDIQRYIARLERKQIARQRGLE